MQRLASNPIGQMLFNSLTFLFFARTALADQMIDEYVEAFADFSFADRIEQRWFPRAEFWDRFAAEIETPAIHFEDHPRLAGFEPPDGEHLGREQAMRFSWNLGAILVELGVAPGPSSRSASAPH